MNELYDKEEVKWIILKSFGVGFAACLVITAVLIFFSPKPDPQIITKVAETTPGQKPDLRIESKTKLTGHAKITPIPTTLPVNQDGNQPGITPPQNGAILALKTGSEIKTELTGEQKVNYLNSNGDLIGSSIHPLTANLTTRVQPDGLDFTLEYPDELNLTVETKPPETHNRIEFGYDGGYFASYSYNFKPVFLKYTYDFGKQGGELSAGLAFEW